MADQPQSSDADGLLGKLKSMDKIAKKMEDAKSQDELLAANQELIVLAAAATADLKAFQKKVGPDDPPMPRARVRLEPDQVAYVHQYTGETLGFVEVDPPAHGETLPLTKEEVTYLAIQVGKAQAEQRKTDAEMRKILKEAARAEKEAAEQRREAIAEIAQRDPEAAAKLEQESGG